jgi:hypothetical protein
MPDAADVNFVAPEILAIARSEPFWALWDATVRMQNFCVCL